MYQIGFADKLKCLGAKILGYEGTPRDLIAAMDEFKEHGTIRVIDVNPLGFITGRQYLQNLGNEARNVFGDTFWIDMVLPQPSLHPANRKEDNQIALERMYPDIDVVCVTDVRYPNEAERIRRLGGLVVHVQRPGVESDGHISEQPLPASLIDVRLVNDGTLEDLRDAVEDALTSLSMFSRPAG